MIKVEDNNLLLDNELHFGHLKVAGEPTELPIMDTGVSHHLKGDKSLLWNFHLLKRPLPLKVATEGNAQFVTGTGELLF